MPKQQVNVLASAARTADPTAVDINTANHRGLIVLLDVTAIAATPSITVNIDGYDHNADETWTLLDGAAVTAVSHNVYRVYPGIAETANVAADDVLPLFVRVSVAHGDTDSITYSIDAILLD